MSRLREYIAFLRRGPRGAAQNEAAQFDGGYTEGFGDGLADHLGAENHTHDWLDVTSPAVRDTALCPCGMLGVLDEVELTTKTIDQLRTEYPKFPWRTT